MLPIENRYQVNQSIDQPDGFQLVKLSGCTQLPFALSINFSRRSLFEKLILRLFRNSFRTKGSSILSRKNRRILSAFLRTATSPYLISSTPKRAPMAYKLILRCSKSFIRLVSS